ncbi:MAG: GWxTD domain-containing protein [Bryobacteraceae bacterium]
MIFDARLGWTLIHFLWQGTLVAGLLWALLPAFSSARVRYALALVFLTVAALAPVVTHLTSNAPPSRIVIPVGELPSFSKGVAAVAPVTPHREWIAWIPLAWITGVTLCSLRLLVAWWAARRLARSGAFLENRWADLAARVGVSHPIHYAESVRAVVPSVIGVFRPVILLPAAVLAKLPVHQLEAVIAHELAHVRRYDYLVNWIQALIETVLFYHPAVWWISSVVRREREVCCDEIAVQATGNDGTVLASALVELEMLRSAAPAMAVTGGDLEARVRRMLGQQPPASPAPLWALGALALLAVLVLLPDRAVSQPRPQPVAAAQAPKPDPREAEVHALRQELARTRAELERVKSELARDRGAALAQASKDVEAANVRQAEQALMAAQDQMQEATRQQKEGARRRVLFDKKKLVEEARARIVEAQADAIRAGILAGFSSPNPQTSGPTGPYRKWLDEDVVYIVTPAERADYERLSTRVECEAFIEKFWKKRDPTPATEANEAKEEHYRRIAFSNDRFGRTGAAGWRTHRGRMYIVNGPPDEIQSTPGKEEVWMYRQQGGGVIRYRFDLTTNAEPVEVR